jgi:hypothetical protein
MPSYSLTFLIMLREANLSCTISSEELLHHKEFMLIKLNSSLVICRPEHILLRSLQAEG